MKAYWKNLNHAKQFVRWVIENYILNGYTLPDMQVQVLNVPKPKSEIDKLSMIPEKSEHETMKEEIEKDLKAMMISCKRKKSVEVLI